MNTEPNYTDATVPRKFNSAVLWGLFQFSVYFLLFLNLLIPLVGVFLIKIGAYLGIVYYPAVFILVVTMSMLATRKHDFLMLKHLKKTDVICIILIYLIVSAVYGNYSPILELRQDPALYAFKGFNLINFNDYNLPIDKLSDIVASGLFDQKYSGYGAIQNGTQINNGYLNTDFLVGPSFHIAFLGLFDKNIAFYFPVLILWSLASLSYLIFTRITDSFSSFVLTVSLITAPIMLWFGKAPYSEPIALLAFMGIFWFFLTYQTNPSSFSVISLLLFLAMGILARIDVSIVLVISIVIASLFSFKIALCVYVLFSLFFFFALSSFSVYSNRMAAVGFSYANIYYLASMALFVSYFLNKFNLVRLTEQIVYEKWFFYLVFSLSIAIVSFIFRNDIAGFIGYEIKLIHGRNIRSYNEDILDRLLMTLPGFLVVVGILNMGNVINNKKVNAPLFLFVLLNFFIFSYYLFDMKNSPQLYWAIRRYLYVIIPLLFISFAFFLEDMKYKMRFVTVLSFFALSLNITFASNQITSEMAGLDESAARFEELYPRSDFKYILYQDKMRYAISPLISYSGFIPIPIGKIDELALASEVLSEPFIFVTDQEVNALPGCIFSSNEKIQYRRTGESYDRLPMDRQYKNFQLFVYTCN